MIELHSPSSSPKKNKNYQYLLIFIISMNPPNLINRVNRAKGYKWVVSSRSISSSSNNFFSFFKGPIQKQPTLNENTNSQA